MWLAISNALRRSGDASHNVEDAEGSSPLARRNVIVGAAFAVTMLLSLAILNLLCLGITCAIRPRLIGIINGLGLLVACIVTIWTALSACNGLAKMLEHKKTLACVWALVPINEAMAYQKCRDGPKPKVSFKTHMVAMTAPTVSKRAIVDTDDLEQQRDSEGNVKDVASEVVQTVPGDREMQGEGVVTDKLAEVERQMSDISHRASCDESCCSPTSAQGCCDSEASTVEPMSSDSSSDSLCCICCLNEFDSSTEVVALLRCGHVYCEECIRSWVTKRPSCPICRSSVLQDN